MFQSENQLEKQLSLITAEKKGIFIVINSTEHGLSKTFHFEPDITVEKMINKFAEKSSVEKPNLYGLYYTESGTDIFTLMDPKDKLNSFKLNNLVIFCDYCLFQNVSIQFQFV